MSAAEATRLGKTALAKRLDISRMTLDRYLKKEGSPKPDRSGAFDVEEVAKFVQENLPIGPGAPQGKNEANSKEGKASLHDLKVEKLSLEIQKLRHALEVDRGEFISKKEAADTIIPIMTELGSLLTQKFEMELPSRYVGRDAVDCAKLNADAIDAVIARFKKGVRKFTT